MSFMLIVKFLFQSFQLLHIYISPIHFLYCNIQHKVKMYYMLTYDSTKQNNHTLSLSSVHLNFE